MRQLAPQFGRSEQGGRIITPNLLTHQMTKKHPDRTQFASLTSARKLLIAEPMQPCGELGRVDLHPIARPVALQKMRRLPQIVFVRFSGVPR